MPIHFSRNINDGFSYNPQVDMLPITGGGDEAGGLKKLIYSALRAEEKDIISWDMYLYCAAGGMRCRHRRPIYIIPAYRQS